MATGQERMGDQETTKRAAEETATDMTVLASGAAVILSLQQFFIKGNKMQGIFIGLWPPTIMAFASYYNQQRIEKSLSELGPGRLRESIEKMVSNR